MSEKNILPSLAERVRALLANTAIFYGAFAWASGNLLPTGGLESVWFLAALALWFFGLLSAPFFVPPRDALANAITAICILVTADLSVAGGLTGPLNVVRWVSVAYCAIVVAFAIAALFIHHKDGRSPAAQLCYRLTGIIGKPEVLFTPAALISIVGAYQHSLVMVAWLLILWTVFILARPMELALLAYRRWIEDSKNSDDRASVGTVERIDHPNIVRVRLSSPSAWKSGSLHIVAMSDGDQKYIIALFTQVQGIEVVGTGLCVASVADPTPMNAGAVCACHTPEKAAEFVQNLSGMKDAKLVGFTVENSTIGTLRFEVAVDSDLAEGDVVFARVRGQHVFYQILDAQTAEESFDQNPRGTHIVNAAQLGCYAPERGFTKYPWLPGMNVPLFWAKNLTFPPPVLSDKEFIIGNVPSTNIGVVADADEIVRYHTAILGVTGTGKTELALDIVREAVKRDVRVFCVDFTGEYRARLADLNPIFPTLTAQQAGDLETKLFAVETGKYGAPDEKKALSQSMKQARKTINDQVEGFLVGDVNKLAVLELLDIANTKASLRLTEQYLSSIMNWARLHRQARQVLIVLEEAHTIIPETFSAGFDGDTQWVVSRIGQIALQGRKYGVGLLVISQRTALVSKTILSQCNTFLTYSLIDQTSLGFLESVYSSQHTRSIPNLGRFEFLAFGKAIRAERPVLLRRRFDQSKKDASDRLRQPLGVAKVETASRDQETKSDSMATEAEVTLTEDLT